MRHALVAGIVALGVSGLPAPTAAQGIEGFATGGIHRDVNQEQFVGAGGGLLLTTADWFTVGAQGDLFFSWPYVAGRGTVFVQGNVNVGATRVFVQAGRSIGEMHGPMYGLGMDIRPRTARVGFRVAGQTYMAERWLSGTKVVQPSVSLGLIWH